MSSLHEIGCFQFLGSQFVKTTISLSQEEVDVLAAAAAKSGMAFSAWVRHVIFDVARIVPRPHAERGLLEGSDR